MNNKSLSDIKEHVIDANQDFRGEIFTTYKDSFSGLIFHVITLLTLFIKNINILIN